MGIRHLYIENPRERALRQIDSYGVRINLGPDGCSVLRECIDEAWDDGHAALGAQAGVGWWQCLELHDES